MYYDPDKITTRWIGYFDLLGTSQLILSGKIFEVFNTYQSVLDRLNSWKKRHANVSHAWFSDTFIVYTEDNSGESFAAIEMVCRWLMFSLVRNKIPVRGSLACGQFYADGANSLYFGEALLEAYQLSENQDWIGMLLCRSSVEQLSELGLPVEERLHYVKYAIPFKQAPDIPLSSIAACIFGNCMKLSDGSSALLKPLKEMMVSQSNRNIIAKYERTIAFLEANRRRVLDS